jgi:hypothetical protein
MTATLLPNAKQQFLDSNGRPLAGGEVYFYIPNTSTLKSTWQDAGKTVLNTNPVDLDANGQAIIYGEGQYRQVVYDVHGNLIWDRLTDSYALNSEFQALSSGLSASSGSALIGFIQAGVGAVVRAVRDKLRERVSIEDFGGTADGVTGNSAAAAAAIAYLKSVGGGMLEFGQGNYLMDGILAPDSVPNGLVIPYSSDNGTSGRIVIRGKGKATRLLAGADNMIIVRMADSHSELRDITLDGNGHTNVTAQALVPENQAQLTQLVSQSYNYSSDIYIKGCAEGIVLRCGPDVGGLDSGCFYNSFTNYHIYDTTRGVWLRSAVDPNTATPNRNKFTNIRIGGSGTRVNTGVQIDAGDTNTFIGVDGEGITNTTGPNATPTVFKIAQKDTVTNFDCNSNTFISCKAEASTRDLDNANTYTEIYASLLTASKCLFTATPRILIGGSDPSVTPQRAPGYIYQNTAAFAGVDQGVMWLDGGLALGPNYAYDQGQRWQNYNLTTSNMTNVTSITEMKSKYTRLGGFVKWDFRVRFQATAVGSNVVITPPRPPADHYTTFNTVQPLLFPYVWQGAGGQTGVGLARFETNKTITFNVPSGVNWNAGNASEIHLMITYIENGY